MRRDNLVAMKREFRLDNSHLMVELYNDSASAGTAGAGTKDDSVRFTGLILELINNSGASIQDGKLALCCSLSAKNSNVRTLGQGGKKLLIGMLITITFRADRDNNNLWLNAVQKCSDISIFPGPMMREFENFASQELVTIGLIILLEIVPTGWFDIASEQSTGAGGFDKDDD